MTTLQRVDVLLIRPSQYDKNSTFFSPKRKGHVKLEFALINNELHLEVMRMHAHFCFSSSMHCDSSYDGEGLKPPAHATASHRAD